MQNKYVLCVDIHSFYPSTDDKKVLQFYKNSLKTPNDIAKVLTELTTFNGHLPTGAPTSVILAFFAYAKTFDDIYMKAQELKIDMSVYVDDVTFSSQNPIPISFYNFGSVGQNEIDNNVGTYTYEDIFIPEIEYVSKDRMIALGNSKFLIFEGAQKPKLKKEIVLEKEVSNVFYTNKYLGTSYSNNDEAGTMHLCVYDMSGNIAMENDTDMQYTNVEFNSNNEICLTNQYECEIYTVHSIKKFAYTFDTAIYKILYESGVNNYIVIREGAMDEVRLK